MIHTMMPFALDRNLGRAYNEAMALIGEEDWACFLDHDAIWTTREWYRQLVEAVEFVPEAGILTAVQSRGWQKWQWDGEANNHDMAFHRRLGREKLQVRTLLDVTENSGIAGVVLCTSKRAWRTVGGFVDGMYCVDHAYHFACAAAGLRVYVVEGLYVYHWRRAFGDAPPADAPTAAGCPCPRIRRTERPPSVRLTLPGPAPVPPPPLPNEEAPRRPRPRVHGGMPWK